MIQIFKALDINFQGVKGINFRGIKDINFQGVKYTDFQDTNTDFQGVKTLLRTSYEGNKGREQRY